MSDFLAMNGYGFYVWSAYAVTGIVLVAELVVLRSRRRAVLEEARLSVNDAEPHPGAAE